MKPIFAASILAVSAFLVAGGIKPPATWKKGVCSYYGERYRNKLMANGKPFNPDALTVAHKSLPFGTKILFKHGPNQVRVTVTDRGPFVAGRDFDLSKRAFSKLAQVEAGVITPKWRIVE
tara:strand:- start:17942 stop:18301 length:360 start_codon:yes stop_codon:yes gene_type:complete